MSTGPLTLDQRAQRAAKRRNRQIAARYPLFADEFATTVDAERQRILRQQEQGKRVIERLAELNLAAWTEGQQLRQVALTCVPADVFAERDATFQKIHGHRPREQIGSNFADFWWQVLRNHAPADIKQACCPHAGHHHDLRYWSNSPCPACGMSWTERVVTSSSEATS
jgi:hypothetical protein